MKEQSTNKDCTGGEKIQLPRLETHLDPKDTPPPTRVETRDERKERKRKERQEQHAYKLEQDLALWDPATNGTATMDPFKTLFVARITTVAYWKQRSGNTNVYSPYWKQRSGNTNVYSPYWKQRSGNTNVYSPYWKQRSGNTNVYSPYWKQRSGNTNVYSPYWKQRSGNTNVYSPYWKQRSGNTNVYSPYWKQRSGNTNVYSPYWKQRSGNTNVYSPYWKQRSGNTNLYSPLAPTIKTGNKSGDSANSLQMAGQSNLRRSGVFGDRSRPLQRDVQGETSNYGWSLAAPEPAGNGAWWFLDIARRHKAALESVKGRDSVGGDFTKGSARIGFARDIAAWGTFSGLERRCGLDTGRPFVPSGYTHVIVRKPSARIACCTQHGEGLPSERIT
ncbi:hypothetical protein RRG08_032636 [Elysia crispata]|uniref:U1 small nuclear ribonucleoprotein of 70kDa N-terminal domain-containing protein n=1 Tax=Elysia crispata TaxID=231223 RepID=A0AAE0Y0P2_9GAST|nr:hypothetical protein RRG08_032636 [Elysia crispata]